MFHRVWRLSVVLARDLVSQVATEQRGRQFVSRAAEPSLGIKGRKILPEFQAQQGLKNGTASQSGSSRFPIRLKSIPNQAQILHPEPGRTSIPNPNAHELQSMSCTVRPCSGWA